MYPDFEVDFTAAFLDPDIHEDLGDDEDEGPFGISGEVFEDEEDDDE